MAGILRRHRWRFAGWVTLALFALFSVLPIWTAWYAGSWEANGKLASFWTMLASVPGAAEQARPAFLVELYGAEVIKLAILLVVGLGVGRWLADHAARQA